MKTSQPDRKQLRTFGIGLTVVLSVIAILQILLLRRLAIGIGLFSAGAVALIVVVLSPTILSPVYRGMLVISRAIGTVTTPVMLGLVFYLAFAPASILLRLFKKDILDRKFDVKSASYWKAREAPQQDSTRYERQY